MKLFFSNFTKHSCCRDTEIGEEKPIVTMNKKISKPKSLSRKKTVRISIEKKASSVKRNSSNRKILGSRSSSSGE